MAKQNLKTMKVCKLCEQGRALGMPMTKTTGLVGKKPMTGLVCIGCVGTAICGWQEMVRA